MSCLNYMGVITWLSQFISPVFNYIGLSGDAAFVFITSILVNIYSAIGVMAALGFDYRAVTILAVMCLIAHNLIIETAIQKKAWGSAKVIITLRIVSAFVAGALLNLILPADMTGKLIFGDVFANPTSWSEVIYSWASSVGMLTLKMVLFIFGLNILQNILREFHVIDLLIYPMRPLMRIFGLPESTSFLWIIANSVGLTYGGALLIEEINLGGITKKDASLFNTHVSVSHSLLEDTLLFATIGIGVFWLIVPRLFLAIVSVWIQKIYKMLHFRPSVLGTMTKN